MPHDGYETYRNLFNFCSLTDLGHGELDQSLQIKKLEQASLNTTKAVFSEINDTQLLIHIGDLSYAVGFAAQVSS